MGADDSGTIEYRCKYQELFKLKGVDHVIDSPIYWLSDRFHEVEAILRINFNQKLFHHRPYAEKWLVLFQYLPFIYNNPII